MLDAWLKSTGFGRQQDLGEGSTATVILAVAGERKVAVKHARPAFKSPEEGAGLYWATPVDFYEEDVGFWDLDPEGALAAEIDLLQTLEFPYVRVDSLNEEAPKGTAALEYIEGSSWRSLLGSDALAWPQLMKLVESLSTSQLKFHGDLKPDNLMLDVEGTLRILDPSSGIAELKDGRPHSLLTTRLYNPVLAASDVPALGLLIAEVMLGHHILTGKQNKNSMTSELTEVIDWMCRMGFGATTRLYGSMTLAETASPWEAVALRCLGLRRTGPGREMLDVEDAYRSVHEVYEAMKELKL